MARRRNKKERSPMEYIIILIGAVCIIYGLFMLYQKYQKKEEVVDVKEEERMMVADLWSLYSFTTEEDKDAWTEEDRQKLQEEKSITGEELSDNYKLVLARKNASLADGGVSISSITGAMSNLLGKNITYERIDFNYGEYQYVYNPSRKFYESLKNEKYVELDYELISTYTYEITDTSLLIDEYFVYTMKDKTKSFSLSSDLDVVITEENIFDHQDIVEHYRYVFQKENDSYYLEKIENIE